MSTALPPRTAQPPWLEPATAEPRERVAWLAHWRTWLLVAGFAAVALGIRLLVVRGIWVDEAISVHQAQMPFGEMLDDLRATDNHPPLHHILLWLSTRVLGTGELAVRIPTILAGTLLVPALFLAGRELFDRRAGLAAAGFGAVAPLLIWYSQEARMYALVMLFATLAVWAQMRVLNADREGAPSGRYWFAYGACVVALVYSNYFTLIPIAIQQLAFGVAAWRRAHRGEPVQSLLTGYWITWVAIVAALAPLGPLRARPVPAQRLARASPTRPRPARPPGSTVPAPRSTRCSPTSPGRSGATTPTRPWSRSRRCGRC